MADDNPLAAVFHEAQISLAKHKRAAERMRAIQRSMPMPTFFSHLWSNVALLLRVYKREPAAERLVEFLVSYVTRSADDVESMQQEDLVNALCLRLLTYSTAKDKAIRFRVSQIVARVMNSLPEDAEVSDELFEAIESTMVQRCRDKVPVVRAWATRALFRLQDPSTVDDPITGEILRMMAHDASKEVRMSAISTIAPSKPAIAALIARVRDGAPEVRLHALATLKDKIEMRWLSISQRAALLTDALGDRLAPQRAAGGEIVRTWVRKLDGKPVALMRALDAVSYEAAAESVLSILIDDAEYEPLVGDAAAEWATLAPEPLMCLRMRLERLAARAADAAGAEQVSATSALDAALPELPAICDALSRATNAARVEVGEGDGVSSDADAVVARFALSQLLRVAALVDTGDEHGREQLERLLCDAARSLQTADEHLAPVLKALERAARGGRDDFERLLLELISEIEDPLEAADADDECAAARLEAEQARMLTEARLATLSEEVRERVSEEDFEAAAALKKTAAELQATLAALPPSTNASAEEEAERCSRALRLSELMLRTPSLGLDVHEVSALKERFLAALTSPRPALRGLAFRCISLHALTSAEAAATTWPLLVKALEHDQPTVQLAALGGCVDLILFYGPQHFLEKAAHPPAARASPLAPVDDSYSRAVVELIRPHLRSSDRQLRAAAALGACKLLHTGRIVSVSLMTHLLHFYFESEADDADASGTVPPVAPFSADVESTQLATFLASPKQFLSTFMAAAAGSKSLAPAFLPAVRAVLAAAPGSSEETVPVDALGTFILALTRPAGGDDNNPVHIELGLALCFELIVAGETSEESKLLPKLFSHVMLPAAAPTDTAVAHQLRLLATVAGQMPDMFTDKAALRAVHKFIERLDAATKALDDAVDEVDSVDVSAEVAELLLAHKERRDADTDVDVAAAHGRERVRQEEMAKQRRNSTPPKPKAQARRKLAAKGKATPTRMALLADENSSVNAA